MPSSRRPSSLPPLPPAVIAKTLKYSDAQEHLLRRLGCALVMQWDAVPDELQDLIIDQAAVVDDRTDAPHEAGDIENFVRTAKMTALAAQAAPVEE